MKIYIPTNREPNQQLTYDRIPPVERYKYDVTLVVNDIDLGLRLSSAGYKVVVNNAPDGIQPARQWILDNSVDPKVLMLDDDLANWSYRVQGTTSYKKDENGNAFRNAFAVVDGMLDRVAHAGIGHRQFANTQNLVAHNCRIMRALAYNVKVLADTKIRTTLPLMEDFELGLKLLTTGYGNLNYYGVVQDQPSSDNGSGCSKMRTAELQEHCARELQKMFPDFVKLVQKEGWAIGPRWDVQVKWAAAAKQGARLR